MADQDLCSHAGCMKPRHAYGLCQMHGARKRRGQDMDRPNWWERTIADRLWEKVKKQEGDGCWEWFGAADQHGYGSMTIEHRRKKAHRVSYELVHGPIPEGLHLCHKCDNPKCVRPDHLFPGTAKVNLQDAAAKGLLAGEIQGVAKLSNDQAKAIYQSFIESSGNPRSVAERHGVSRSCIIDLLKGRRWSFITHGEFGVHRLQRVAQSMYRLVAREAEAA